MTVNIVLSPLRLTCGDHAVAGGAWQEVGGVSPAGAEVGGDLAEVGGGQVRELHLKVPLVIERAATLHTDMHVGVHTGRGGRKGEGPV